MDAHDSDVCECGRQVVGGRQIAVESLNPVWKHRI